MANSPKRNLQRLKASTGGPAAALTATPTVLTSLTPASAPSSPDYAIADPVAEGGAGNHGFSTADEFKTVMSVILNLQQRVLVLEANDVKLEGVLVSQTVLTAR
jgi:hypothetical protein